MLIPEAPGEAPFVYLSWWLPMTLSLQTHHPSLCLHHHKAIFLLCMFLCVSPLLISPIILDLEPTLLQYGCNHTCKDPTFVGSRWAWIWGSNSTHSSLPCLISLGLSSLLLGVILRLILPPSLQNDAKPMPSALHPPLANTRVCPAARRRPPPLAQMLLPDNTRNQMVLKHLNNLNGNSRSPASRDYKMTL